MAELMEFKVEGFDELTKKMFVRLPSTVRKMAFNLDANIASEGRLKELSGSANRLAMGKEQITSYKGIRRQGIFSKWDRKVGWVSTTRQAGKGNTGFRMASFAWERARKSSVTADYTNQLANLWANPTKPYTSRSPLVGQAGRRLGRWGVGQSRPSKYSWSTVYTVLSGTAPSALAKTEVSFQKELNKL